MLKLIVKGTETYDQKSNTFSEVGGFEVQLEHSLLSLSKWESKFQKPFLSNEKMNTEEVVYYIMCMVVGEEITKEMATETARQFPEEINTYINSSQSATTFGKMPQKQINGEVITSELIYYWMVAFTITFETEHWHLNRLFSLIRICNEKNEKPKKLSRTEIAMRNKELNDKRRAELGTRG